MATNELGITVPAGSDAFDPQGDMVDLANSLRSRVVVPVANTTARAALVAAISWTPSASEPLRVHRADGPLGLRDEITYDGTTWYPETQILPEPTSATGASTNVITATSWANLPTDLALAITLPVAAWVLIEAGAWMTKTTTSDLRAGVALSGATTQTPEATAWGDVMWVGANFSAAGLKGSLSKVVKLNAGTTTARLQAYLATTGGSNSVNYPILKLTPLRPAL